MGGNFKFVNPNAEQDLWVRRVVLRLTCQQRILATFRRHGPCHARLVSAVSRWIIHTHGSSPRELQMARSMCWHCQSEVSGEYFCDRCVKVQPVSKELDYFTCLGLPRRLIVDLSQLEAKFYELSRAFHPDFYLNKSETEQAISLGNAATLNSAYRTLRDPIQRAEYLLDLEAGAVKEIRTSPPADLFEDILQLQETLDAYRATDRTSESAQTLRTELQAGKEGS